MKRCTFRLGSLIGAVFLLTACTVAKKRQVLTFFFDGVPSETPPVAPATLAPALLPTTNAGLPDLYLAARATPPGVRHKPYADRQCLSCHESQFSQKLRGEVAVICQLCHKGVLGEKPFRHAPAEAGYCLGCHDPHESMERALLVKPGRQVCADCHEEKLVLGTPAHAKIGSDACHGCHDPHGGRNKYFLREPLADRPAALLPTGTSR